MWQAYIKEHGALGPVHRDKALIEHFHWACAQICSTVARSVGAKMTTKDFMPKLTPEAEVPEAEEKYATIEDVMRVLQAARVK